MEVLQACPTGRRARTLDRLCLSAPWEHLGILPEELDEVTVEKEVCTSLIKLLPHDQTPERAGGQ